METIFGVIKEVMGFRRFHLRGLHAAGGEWTLVSLAWNLKRMHALAASTQQEQGWCLMIPGTRMGVKRLLTRQSPAGLPWCR